MHHHQQHAALHHTGSKASPEKVRKITEANKGRPSSNRRLTEEQVREIAVRLCEGETVTALAKEYGLARAGIQHIRDGLTYRDWLPDYPDEVFPLGRKEKIRKPARVRNRKFSVQEVTDIRIRLLENEAVQAIARRYGAGETTIINIRDNVTYQDIPWPEEIMRLHRTDNMIKLAMLMLSLPLNPAEMPQRPLVVLDAVADGAGLLDLAAPIRAGGASIAAAALFNFGFSSARRRLDRADVRLHWLTDLETAAAVALQEGRVEFETYDLLLAMQETEIPGDGA